MNTKKKQLVMSLGIGLVCAVLGTFLVSKYTGQMTSQFSTMATDLQKKVEEKSKSAESLEKQLKNLQSSYVKLSNQLANKPELTPEVHDPSMRYVTVPVDESQGWNTHLDKNSLVDIACTMKIKDKNLTNVVLKNILVAKLDKPAGPSSSSKTLAYLALKPNEASMFINAMGACKLYFIESSKQVASYTPVIDMRHFKPTPKPAMPKLNLYQLPPPAPMVVALPKPQPEIQKLTVIKGSSQEQLEFAR